jgi:thiamine-phosphate pyrophosphorylase
MKLSGFYGVVDNPASVAEAVALAGKLVEGGACVVQLRVKRGSMRGFVELARALVAAVAVPLIVNDRLDVALVAGAAGVHLGQDDLPLAAARRAASSAGLLIGVSTHDPRQAAEAAGAGADYLGFGPIFATTTKENPDPVQGLEGLALAVRAAGDIPVVAIGGIRPEHAAAIAATGAAAACAISAVNGAPDVVVAARQVADAFMRR